MKKITFLMSLVSLMMSVNAFAQAGPTEADCDDTDSDSRSARQVPTSSSDEPREAAGADSAHGGKAKKAPH